MDPTPVQAAIVDLAPAQAAPAEPTPAQAVYPPLNSTPAKAADAAKVKAGQGKKKKGSSVKPQANVVAGAGAADGGQGAKSTAVLEPKRAAPTEEEKVPAVQDKTAEKEEDAPKVAWHQELEPQGAEGSKGHAKTAARLVPNIERDKSVAAPNKPVDAAILRWNSVEDLQAAANLSLSLAKTEQALSADPKRTFHAMPSVVTWNAPPQRKPAAGSTSPFRTLCLEIPEHGVVENPKLEDFQLLRLVGKGGFGKVYQVRKKKSGRIMALKAMRKHLIVEELNVEGTHNERSVLESVQHPFVIRLHCAFHDHGRLYLLMDWHNGGHLLKLLHEHAPFMEKEVRFYMAELVLAIEGLHSRGIVHRDLKPENVLLDSNGHLIVTDFGASKISAKDDEDIRTNSWVGTVLYMAPEQLMGKVYGRVVDWWAVGLLCWEMLTGDNPFYHENPEQVAARVQKKKLHLPSHFHSDTHTLLKALLNRDPEKRLGCKGTADVKGHAFFSKAKGFSWTDSYEKKHTPPFYVPGLHENPDDVSQVDDHYTSVPAVMSPVDPTLLSPNAQEQFKGFEWVSPLYSPAVSRMPVPDLLPTQLDLAEPADLQPADAAIQKVANAVGGPSRTLQLAPSNSDMTDLLGPEEAVADVATGGVAFGSVAAAPGGAWGRAPKISGEPTSQEEA